MDVNGTRYHLLLGHDDWASCVLDERGSRRLGDTWPPTSDDQRAFDWDADRNELTLKSEVFRFVAPPRLVLPTIDERRGAGRDANGNWYWIGPNRQEILVTSSGSGRTSHFWSATDPTNCPPEPRFGEFGPAEPPAPGTPLDLQGLAVTQDQYLVVGVLAPAGLLVFDLFEGGPPRQIVFPRGIDFVPFDMAARPQAGVWVLDRTNRRYWAFDAGMNVVPREQPLVVLEPGEVDAFQPVGLDPADPAALRRREPRSMPAGLSLDAASPVDLEDPISIEGLPDGSVLILDHAPSARSSHIVHFRFSVRLDPVLDTSVMEPYLEPGRTTAELLRGHDLAFVPAPAPGAADATRQVLGQLYVASAQGTQTFVFDLVRTDDRLLLEPLRRYLPMRLFGGMAIVASGGQVYYDSADRWLPLVQQDRPRYVDQGSLYTPIAAGTPVFDGHEPNCTWHRLMIDACLPHGAQIDVQSRAANDLDTLLLAAWQSEPALGLRSDGIELPFAGQQGPYDTWELLFQRARGRFLQLRLTLRGTGQTSPHIRALRTYYPRFSYLDHYLPAVYREDDVSASFLDRFLANFEGMYTTIEDRVADAQTLFDPRTAPSDALDWLASWFAVALDPAWDETRRRLFIRYAMLFFRQRGTLNGLYMALQIAFGDCIDERVFTTPLARRGTITAIRIVEEFRRRRTPGVVLGDPTDPNGLRVVTPQARWTPQAGRAQLQQRYTTFAATQPPDAVLPSQFDIVAPAAASARAAWTTFCRDVLGFVPSQDAADDARWHAFLARRYVGIDTLNDRYRLVGTDRYASFDAVPQPAHLPPDGAALQDWYQFQAVVLPMQRTAHRFVVLLPVPTSGSLTDVQRRDRISLAQRVVDLEKPAHTACDVRFYWALFRVGEARLGLDTLVERGSRSPEILTPFILGQGHLVESYLATPHVAPACRSYVAGDQR